MILKALRGKRVLNSRPAHQAAELTKLLEARGAAVLEVPGLLLVSCAEKSELERYTTWLRAGDWLVFTSVNGVRFFAELGGSMRSFAPGVRVSAIGPATTEAAECLGVPVTLVPEVAIAEHLGRAIADTVRGANPGSIRALLVRSRKGDPSISEILSSASVEVESLFVYDSVAPEWPSETITTLLSAVRQRELDLIVATSAESLRNLTNLCEREGFGDKWRSIPVAVIGEKTAAAARALGIERIVTSQTHSMMALCEAASKYFEDSEDIEGTV